MTWEIDSKSYSRRSSTRPAPDSLRLISRPNKVAEGSVLFVGEVPTKDLQSSCIDMSNKRARGGTSGPTKSSKYTFNCMANITTAIFHSPSEVLQNEWTLRREPKGRTFWRNSLGARVCGSKTLKKLSARAS